MSPGNPSTMSNVDRERADVLRAEWARLCWLAIHDKKGGEGERLLREKLAAVRATVRNPGADED